MLHGVLSAPPQRGRPWKDTQTGNGTVPVPVAVVMHNASKDGCYCGRSFRHTVGRHGTSLRASDARSYGRDVCKRYTLLPAFSSSFFPVFRLFPTPHTAHRRTQTRTRTHRHVNAHAHTHTHTYTCSSTHRQRHTRIHTRRHTHTHTHKRALTRTHTHTHWHHLTHLTAQAKPKHIHKDTCMFTAFAKKCVYFCRFSASHTRDR